MIGPVTAASRIGNNAGSETERGGCMKYFSSRRAPRGPSSVVQPVTLPAFLHGAINSRCSLATMAVAALMLLGMNTAFAQQALRYQPVNTGGFAAPIGLQPHTAGEMLQESQMAESRPLSDIGDQSLLDLITSIRSADLGISTQGDTY